MIKTRSLFPERDDEIFKLSQQGVPQKDIGEKFNLTVGRIRQLVKRHRKAHNVPYIPASILRRKNR